MCDDSTVEGGCCRQAELLGLLRECFVRTEPWLQAGKYVPAVASGLARRNGWTIAERGWALRRRVIICWSAATSPAVS